MLFLERVWAHVLRHNRGHRCSRSHALGGHLPHGLHLAVEVGRPLEVRGDPSPHVR